MQGTRLELKLMVLRFLADLMVFNQSTPWINEALVELQRKYVTLIRMAYQQQPESEGLLQVLAGMSLLLEDAWSEEEANAQLNLLLSELASA